MIHKHKTLKVNWEYSYDTESYKSNLCLVGNCIYFLHFIMQIIIRYINVYAYKVAHLYTYYLINE